MDSESKNVRWQRVTRGIPLGSIVMNISNAVQVGESEKERENYFLPVHIIQNPLSEESDLINWGMSPIITCPVVTVCGLPFPLPLRLLVPPCTTDQGCPHYNGTCYCYKGSIHVWT